MEIDKEQSSATEVDDGLPGKTISVGGSEFHWDSPTRFRTCNKTPADLERFIMERIVVTGDGCWELRVCKINSGYTHVPLIHPHSKQGRFRIPGHRLMWLLKRGPILGGLFVCHHCDNRLCVNPDHLFLGTNSDNIRDMFAKGRHTRNIGEDNGVSKLTNKDIPRIRKMISRGISQREVAVVFGVSRAAIEHIVNGETWRHVA